MNTPEVITESAYVTLRPILFRALSILARRGFAAPPSEGLDLIHDFFVEAWGAIARNYDPAKGPLESYVYQAFVRFARPRIVRMNRLRLCLWEPKELAQRATVRASSEPSELDLEKPRLRRALIDLSDPERRIIGAYFGSNRSERRLARDFSLSRYGLRNQVAEVLGKIAARLGRPSGIGALDWKVARLIWGENRSVSEAATILGRTERQIRSAHRRNLQEVLEALAASHSRKVGAKEEPMSEDALKLFLRVLSTTADLSSTIGKRRQPLLPVREIRNVIPSRIVLDELQRMRGCQGFAWQHRRHEESRLRERQGRRFF